jgi:hypothetical protein
VHVPRFDAEKLLARRQTTPGVDVHQPHARFDEPPRQQQILTHRMPTIAVAHGITFAGDIERLARSRTSDQVVGSLLEMAQSARPPGTRKSLLSWLHLTQQLLALG